MEFVAFYMNVCRILFRVNRIRETIYPMTSLCLLSTSVHERMQECIYLL